MHDLTVDRAESPTRLAVNLAVRAADLRRGDLLTSDAALPLTARFDAELRGLAALEARRARVRPRRIGARGGEGDAGREAPTRGDAASATRLVLSTSRARCAAA